MATSEKARAMNGPEKPSGVTMLADAAPADRSGHNSVDEQIRLRAYALYLERGAEPNDDLGDWLQAEREYREQSQDDRSRSEDSHDWAR